MSKDASDVVWLELNNLFDALVEFAMLHEGPIWNEANEDMIDKLVFGAKEEDGEQIEYALEKLMQLFGFSEESDFDDGEDWEEEEEFTQSLLAENQMRILGVRSGRIQLDKSNITEIDPHRFYLASKGAFDQYGQQCIPIRFAESVNHHLDWLSLHEKDLWNFKGSEFVIVDGYDGSIKAVWEVGEGVQD